jgi:sterol desaturase/sphingolipid hydroxylase (fatty acid hydroxylase superfamily)
MSSNMAVALPQRTRFIRENITRSLYLPAMIVGINGLGIWLAARSAPKVAFVALLAGAIALSFVAERVAPYEATWNRNIGDAPRDVAHALVNETMQIGSLLLVPTFVGWFTIAELWPTALPFVVQVVIAVIVLDAGITIGHYASHRNGALWRFHAVHHSVERFYGFNGLMKHPAHQLFETALGTAPLIVVGMPTDVATALVVCVAVQLLLQHSNVDYAVGPIGKALALNHVHRFHHLRWAGVGDVNFGLFTTLWDRLLGTSIFDPSKRFTSSDIGIDARPDFPVDYVGQLVDPFRRRG